MNEEFEEHDVHKKRQLNRVIPKSKNIVDLLEAPLMWKMGFEGVWNKFSFRISKIKLFFNGLRSKCECCRI